MERFYRASSPNKHSLELMLIYITDKFLFVDIQIVFRDSLNQNDRFLRLDILTLKNIGN